LLENVSDFMYLSFQFSHVFDIVFSETACLLKRCFLKYLTETEIEKYWGYSRSSYFDNANIGLQCGKRSGLTLIDVDDWNPAIWTELTAGLNIDNWLMSKRTNDRSHIFFKYTVDLKAQKHHDLGIEILTDGNNAVLPPSKHKSGRTYSFDREITGSLKIYQKCLKNSLTGLQPYLEPIIS
jgi:hypothetical protein